MLVANLDGDSKLEIVVGAPGPFPGLTASPKGVLYVYQSNHPGPPSLEATISPPPAFDLNKNQFGFSLAVGLVTNDDEIDLVVGSPGNYVNQQSGKAFVFHGPWNWQATPPYSNYTELDETSSVTLANRTLGYRVAVADVDSTTGGDLKAEVFVSVVRFQENAMTDTAGAVAVFGLDSTVIGPGSLLPDALLRLAQRRCRG